MTSGFRVIYDNTVNPPANVEQGLQTVAIYTPKGACVNVTVNEEGEIVKINGVNVKGRLYAL